MKLKNYWTDASSILSLLIAGWWNVDAIVVDKERTCSLGRVDRWNIARWRVSASAYRNGFHSFPAADSGLTGPRGFLGIADWGVLKAGAALLWYCFLQFATALSCVVPHRYLAVVVPCYIRPRFNTCETVNLHNSFHRHLLQFFNRDFWKCKICILSWNVIVGMYKFWRKY